MLSASGFYAVFDSLNKYLTGIFTPGEIAFARFGLGALVMFPSLLQQTLWRDRRQTAYLVVRGLLGAGAFYALILALRTSHLSVTMVLFYTNPVWALFLAAYFLREELTSKRFAGVVVALVGISVLMNPWRGGIALGHLYALSAGFMVGVSMVLIRYLRTRHDARVIYAFQCFIGILFTIPLIASNIRLPGPSDGIVLVLSATFGLLGQVTINYGFRFIRAAEGTTLVMTEAIITAIIGITIFREPVTVRFIVGAILIISSGIYLGLQAEKKGANHPGAYAEDGN
jgi:drug/metabolite transporter (DMT)-like permease